jgi:hypothetical protein
MAVVYHFYFERNRPKVCTISESNSWPKLQRDDPAEHQNVVRQKVFLGNKSLGNKCLGKKCLGKKCLGKKSLGKKIFTQDHTFLGKMSLGVP